VRLVLVLAAVAVAGMVAVVVMVVRDCRLLLLL
jgi:hypothetical protein